MHDPETDNPHGFGPTWTAGDSFGALHLAAACPTNRKSHIDSMR